MKGLVELSKSLPDNRSSGEVVKASIQGRRNTLGRYSGQSGSVYTKGDMYIGRYRVRAPETKQWIRKSLVIGRRKEMTESAAKRKLKTMLDELGVNNDTNLMKAFSPSQTFKQKATRWEENDLIMCKPSSENIPYVINKHLIPPFGDLPLDEITEDRVKAWRTDLVKQGKLAPKTISNVWKILRLILGKKHVLGWDIKMPPIPRKEQRYIRPEEAEQIINEAEGQFKLVFELDFQAGMRFGELAGLYVEDLDFENSIIHIRRSAYKKTTTTPKSDAGYRDVPIKSGTMAKLKEFIGDRQSGLVFSSRKGTPLVHSNVNRYVLKPICKKLGIDRATTHAFRHGRVSVLQKNRVPGDMIKNWVGHTNLKITSNYTHFSKEDEREVLDSLK
jgi:integrase